MQVKTAGSLQETVWVTKLDDLLHGALWPGRRDRASPVLAVAFSTPAALTVSKCRCSLDGISWPAPAIAEATEVLQEEPCEPPGLAETVLFPVPPPNHYAWLLRAAEQMLQCPQRGLHLIRGRNEPFQQRLQSVKALGSVQTLVVVSKG